LPFASTSRRFDENARVLPSGENTGKPSKPGLDVMRSRFEPSMSTAHRSNSALRGLRWFDEKMMRLPFGKKNGANDAPARYVIWRASEPSAFAT
jgi:hypothetical protein